MPAKSKQQQKFFGVVKAMQKGDIPKKGAAGKVAKSMTKKDVDKYASTKHKNLPDTVDEDEVDVITYHIDSFDDYLDAHPDFNAALNGHPDWI